MPDYCSLNPINEVPPVEEMEYFKPYFKINPNDEHFTAYIRVPDDCLEIDSVATGYPSGGYCGGANDYQCMITLGEKSSCTSTGETVLSTVLYYEEDPTGEILQVYVDYTVYDPNAEVKNSEGKQRVRH